MNKKPFHDYDPYDHLNTVTLRLEEVINQHNRLSQYTELLNAKISKLEMDHAIMSKKLRQIALNK